jgi:hypothetical protein
LLSPITASADRSESVTTLLVAKVGITYWSAGPTGTVTVLDGDNRKPNSGESVRNGPLQCAYRGPLARPANQPPADSESESDSDTVGRSLACRYSEQIGCHSDFRVISKDIRVTVIKVIPSDPK